MVYTNYKVGKAACCGGIGSLMGTVLHIGLDL
jgi:hypothetical protein